MTIPPVLLLLKARVRAHTRRQGGKIVHVREYQNRVPPAMDAPSTTADQRRQLDLFGARPPAAEHTAAHRSGNKADAENRPARGGAAPPASRPDAARLATTARPHPLPLVLTDQKPKRIAVWHGSRHAFDQFSADKIGSGEGSQALGWGIYLAEERNVAETYRRAGHRTINGRPLDYDDPTDYAAWTLDDYNGDREQAWRHADARLQEAYNQPTGYRRDKAIRFWKEVSRLLASDAPLPKLDDGHLYQATIPAGPYLESDAPWEDQPPEVREALRALGVEPPKQPETLVPFFDDKANAWRLRNKETGEKIWAGFPSHAAAEQAAPDIAQARYDERRLGVWLRMALAEKLGSEKAASLALRRHGIIGIKYADQQSRTKVALAKQRQRLAELENDLKADPDNKALQAAIKDKRRLIAEDSVPPTYNYVIFDDADIEPVKRDEKMIF